ncbi:GatB/YqeY domain-containing protein [Alteromonadaceae bacterium BrNp21-10]|nr:GatB/YqeY domain-containing protein [Alteromonadaceae bacterium BrNp21-10]
MSLILQLKDAQIAAMRAKDKLRLGTIRMAMAQVKQIEIDERRELSESDVLSLLTKMVKQRKDAASQFTEAGRDDLASTELAEIEILNSFLPQALTADEVKNLIEQAVSETGAAGMQDMGKLMAWLKPKAAGRADMGKISGLIKARLTA